MGIAASCTQSISQRASVSRAAEATDFVRVEDFLRTVNRKLAV